jgi:hypothetical protein
MTPEAPSQIWLALAAESLPFERGVEADALVDVVGILGAVGAGDLERHDLLLEVTGLRRRDRALMAVVGVFVELILRQAVLLGHHLGAGELAEHDVRIPRLDARALVIAKAVLGRELR